MVADEARAELHVSPRVHLFPARQLVSAVAPTSRLQFFGTVAETFARRSTEPCRYIAGGLPLGSGSGFGPFLAQLLQEVGRQELFVGVCARVLTRRGCSCASLLFYGLASTLCCSRAVRWRSSQAAKPASGACARCRELMKSRDPSESVQASRVLRTETPRMSTDAHYGHAGAGLCGSRQPTGACHKLLETRHCCSSCALNEICSCRVRTVKWRERGPQQHQIRWQCRPRPLA